MVAQFGAVADDDDGANDTCVSAALLSAESVIVDAFDTVSSCRSSRVALPEDSVMVASGIPIELDLYSVSSQMGDVEAEQEDGIQVEWAVPRGMPVIPSHLTDQRQRSSSENNAEHDRHGARSERDDDISISPSDPDAEKGDHFADHRSTTSGESRLSGGTFVLLDDIIDEADIAPTAPATDAETPRKDPAADPSASVDAASPGEAADVHRLLSRIDDEDPSAGLHGSSGEDGGVARSQGESLSTIPERTAVCQPPARSQERGSPGADSTRVATSSIERGVLRALSPPAIRRPRQEDIQARAEADGLIWPNTADEVIESLAGRFPWPTPLAIEAEQVKTQADLLDVPQYSPGLSTISSDVTTGPTSLRRRSNSSSRSSSNDSDEEHIPDEARDVHFTLSPSRVTHPPRFRGSHPAQLHSRAPSQSAWSDLVDGDADTRSLFAVAEGYHVHLALSEETRRTLEDELRQKAKSVPDLLLVGQPETPPALPSTYPPLPPGPPPPSLPTSPQSPRTPSPTLRNRVRARARERHLSMAGSPSPPVTPYASEPLPALPVPPPRKMQELQADEEEGEVVLIQRRQGPSHLQPDSRGRASDPPEARLGSPWSPSAATTVSHQTSSATQNATGKSWSPPSTATPSSPNGHLPPSAGIMAGMSFPPVPQLSRSVPSSEQGTPSGSRSSASSHMMSPDSISSGSSFGDIIGSSHTSHFYGARFVSPRTGASGIGTIQEERGSPDKQTLSDLDLKGSQGYHVAWGAQGKSSNGTTPALGSIKTDHTQVERSFPPTSFSLPTKPRHQARSEDGSWSIADYPELLPSDQRGPASENGHDGFQRSQSLTVHTTRGTRPRQASGASTSFPASRTDQLLHNGNGAYQIDPMDRNDREAPADVDIRGFQRDSGTSYAHRSRRENQSYSSNYSASSHPFSAASSRSGGAGFGRRPSTSDSVDAHPYATLAHESNASEYIEKHAGADRKPIHQVSLVDEDAPTESNEVCPICVESLSSTYRLPGEKAHVTPLCGHSLHHECFVTVYGPVPESAALLKRTNFGMCGVCRKPMQLLDEDEFGGGVGKPKQSSKFAAMAGMTSPPRAAASTGNASASRSGIPKSASATSLQSSGQQSEVGGDDPLDIIPATTPAPKPTAPAGQVIIPSISIKPEHTSLMRKGTPGTRQVLTCLITVEAPQSGPRPPYLSPMDTAAPAKRLPPASLPKSLPDRSTASSLPNSGPDPFAHVAADLQHRLIDYKSSGLDSLGPIKLYDILRVRKGTFVLQIYVYLFEQALICVSEEKKKGLRGLLSSQSSQSLRSADGRDRGKRDKTPLKLTGRIYLHHVKRIVDSTVQGELSLTIAMRDEALDSFILTFNDRSSLEMWRTTLQRLLGQEDGGPSSDQSGGQKSAVSTSSLGGKLAKMGFDDATLAFVTGSAQSPTSAAAETRQFSDFSPSNIFPSNHTHRSDNSISGRTAGSLMSAGSPVSPQNSSASRSRYGLAPLAPQHTPLDLLIVTSLPPRSGPGSAASAMKQRIILATLEFVMALLGPRDRLSLVAFEPWQGGCIRRTPLLCPAKAEGRRKLETFLDVIGGNNDAVEDTYLVEGSSEERVDVVAGVNAGLDVLMQRRAKNSLTGMVLVSDTAESIKRSQMDLLLARAEAANVPIHSMGYGKNQDPSALWLMSSHTHGTYTFVKEWYDLRDCMAGIIGGMLSIALSGMKIHLSAREAAFRCRKVSGAISHVISSDGKDIDVELKELQYGQRVEFLVEMEFESGNQRASGDSSGQFAGSSDEGNDSASQRYSSGRSLGKGSNYTTESYSAHAETNGHSDSLLLMSDDRLVDEVPVFDLDCSYRDPAASRSVARLSHPILLTVALLPSISQTQMSSELGVVRRRYELLASESITRCLLLVARANWPQAERLMQETTRILSTIIGQLSGESQRGHLTAMRARREAQSKATVHSLQAILGDIDALLEGMAEQRDMFERDHRNFGAQQAMVLRNQKSWSQRTPTERLYCLEGSLEAVRLSQGWQAS